MNIFDRFPPQLFAPLTGKNNRRAWSLMERLYESFFSPERVPTYPEGYLPREITKDIERFLLDENWDDEDTESALTPLNIRAHGIYRRFVDSGWFIEDRVGHVDYVNMRPMIVQFIETMRQLINDGPQILAGSIQMVYNQIREVPNDPRNQALGFNAAAKSCGHLINSLGAMTLRVRDLMDELSKESKTDIFVQRFFLQHISELYIRDFKQLRTREHPLRLRHEIIGTVQSIMHDDRLRNLLLEGYEPQFGSREAAEEQLERDVARFNKLLDVEDYLQRMDRMIDTATKRGMALLSYRLKASERLEDVIRDVTAAINQAEAAGMETVSILASTGSLMGDCRMRLPNVERPKPVRTQMKKKEIDIESKARRILRKLMIEHRDTTPVAMHRYVEKYLPEGATVTAADLPINGVDDAVSFLVLGRLASMMTHDPELLKHNPLFRKMRFVAAQGGAGSRVDTLYFNTPNFTVTRKAD